MVAEAAPASEAEAAAAQLVMTPHTDLAERNSEVVGLAEGCAAEQTGNVDSSILVASLRSPQDPLADEEGTTPLIVRPSELAGRGVFAASPGKPRAIEYVMSDAGPMSEADEEGIVIRRLEGFEHMMSVYTVDDNGFRDEKGRLRPKSDLAQYIGRCRQDLAYDEGSDAWSIYPTLNYVGLLDPRRNPAAFANDRLLGQVCGETEAVEYKRRDALENAFVMVPGLRRVQRNQLPAAAPILTAAGSSSSSAASSQSGLTCERDNDVEFCSMWFYPRRGWDWSDGSQELTVGYWWPVLYEQCDAYGSICAIS